MSGFTSTVEMEVEEEEIGLAALERAILGVVPELVSLPVSCVSDHFGTGSEPTVRRYRKESFALKEKAAARHHHEQAGDLAGHLGDYLREQERWEDALRWHLADVAHQVRAQKHGASSGAPQKHRSKDEPPQIEKKHSREPAIKPRATPGRVIER